MGFEIVVRPVVFPNIRPAPAQSQPPANDPTKGLCTIHGASGQHIDLPFSWSVTTSTSKQRETKRRVDVARVYQQLDDGTINKENFVDIEVANKLWMQDGSEVIPETYARVKEKDNIEILEVDNMKPISQFSNFLYGSGGPGSPGDIRPNYGPAGEVPFL